MDLYSSVSMGTKLGGGIIATATAAMAASQTPMGKDLTAKAVNSLGKERDPRCKNKRFKR